MISASFSHDEVFDCHRRIKKRPWTGVAGWPSFRQRWNASIDEAGWLDSVTVESQLIFRTETDLESSKCLEVAGC